MQASLFARASSDRLIGRALSTHDSELFFVLADTSSARLKQSTVEPAKKIADCYAAHGLNRLSELDEGFAFLLWDKQKNEVIAARDPLGQHSLFYTLLDSGEVVFSSLPKPLLDLLPQKNRTLDDKHIIGYLTLFPKCLNRTCYEKIKRIPAGCYLKLNLGDKSPEIVRYWDALKIAASPLQFETAEAHYAAFKALYEDVVKDMLNGKTEVASHLSGGLDSSSVTCLAAKIMKKKQGKVLALGHLPQTKPERTQIKAKWNYSDAHYMESVKKHYDNITLKPVLDTEKILFEYTSSLHPSLEQPLMNPSNNLWILKSLEMARDANLTQLLTGAMGNFTVSYPNTPTAKFKPIKSLKRWYRIPFILVNRGLKKIKNGLQQRPPWAEYSALKKQLLKNPDLFDGYTCFEKIKKNFSQYGPGYLLSYSSLPDFMASAGTLFYHRYGVCWQDPTANRRIVEFCLRTPQHIFEKDGRSRLLIREGLKGIMPDLVLNRECHGLQAADWYTKFEQQKDEFEALLKKWQGTRVGDYIDTAHLLKLLKKWNVRKIEKSRGQQYHTYEMTYRAKTLRAIEMGLFLEQALKYQTKETTPAETA